MVYLNPVAPSKQSARPNVTSSPTSTALGLPICYQLTYIQQDVKRSFMCAILHFLTLASFVNLPLSGWAPNKRISSIPPNNDKRPWERDSICGTFNSTWRATVYSQTLQLHCIPNFPMNRQPMGKEPFSRGQELTDAVSDARRFAWQMIGNSTLILGRGWLIENGEELDFWGKMG